MDALVVLIVIGAAVAIGVNVSRALKEAADIQKKRLEKPPPPSLRQGSLPSQDKPDLQSLLEALAQKAEAQGASVRKPRPTESGSRPAAPPPPHEPQPFPEAAPRRPDIEPSPALPQSGAAPSPPGKTRERRRRRSAASFPAPTGNSPEPGRIEGPPLQEALPSIGVPGVVPGDGPARRPSRSLQRALDGKSFWQQAMILKEVLGPPRAVRPYGTETRR